MNYVSSAARLLLGALFLLFGSNIFLHFIPMPPPSGLMAQFEGALFLSHFFYVVGFLQVTSGILLLTNRFVPLGLTLIGPVIVNIFLAHLLMAPSGLPLAIVVVLLWLFAAFGVRSAFAGLFRVRA